MAFSKLVGWQERIKMLDNNYTRVFSLYILFRTVVGVNQLLQTKLAINSNFVEMMLDASMQRIKFEDGLATVEQMDEFRFRQLPSSGRDWHVLCMLLACLKLLH